MADLEPIAPCPCCGAPLLASDAQRFRARMLEWVEQLAAELERRAMLWHAKAAEERECCYAAGIRDEALRSAAELRARAKGGERG